MRQIFIYIVTVLNNVGIRRMGTAKVNAVIRNKIQMTYIPFMYINLTVSTLVLKIHFLSTTVKRSIIDIHADYVAVEQLGFNKGRVYGRRL